MKNEYEVRGFITAIIVNSPKYGRHEALISRSKLERSKEFAGSWYVQWSNKTKSFYVVGYMPKVNGKQKKVLLHRWITNAPDGLYVDHRNHDTLNNTNSNLRVVTNSENHQNRKGAPANSTSGVRGVYWNKTAKKWHVQITTNQVKKHIGLFGTIEEAERASVEARYKYMPFANEIIG